MNLVIQSADLLADEQLAPLHAGIAPVMTERIDAHAVRYAGDGIDLSSRPLVAAFCERAALDFAYVPARRLDTIGLLAMDMDSTLITIECIDELADFAGLKQEVAAITEASMRGEIANFTESLLRRVALLKGLDASALEHVYTQRLQLSPGAMSMLEAARVAGIRTLLVSGGFTFFTERLKARLGIDHALANVLEIVDGKLTGKVLGPVVDAAAKARAMTGLQASLGLDAGATVAIGDGSNDLQMMGAAGLSIAYHAKPVVRDAADVAFNHVGLDGLPRLFL